MRPTATSILFLGTALLAGTVLLGQQHSYTQADIDAGNRLYESTCGSCHGENGDKTVGVSFSKGQFKTARSDEDIVRIIRSGVPNTAMPPHSLSEAQAGTIVAYIRSMVGGPISAERGNVAAPAGDAT